MSNVPNSAFGREETLAAIEDLKTGFESGEITCAALRVFHTDGTWEDMAIGGTDEEQEAVMARMLKMYEQAH